ncbi:MAG: transposase domain-containing protein [Rickettsiales bacterium]|nr:transposase domain-containing protein [Rickettsiales bacterium]
MIYFSFFATCKISNINPQKHLHKLLAIIASYNHKKIESLLPWNLKLD